MSFLGLLRAMAGVSIDADRSVTAGPSRRSRDDDNDDYAPASSATGKRRQATYEDEEDEDEDEPVPRKDDLKALDKFYTNVDVAERLVDNFFDVVQPKRTDILVEPSAGGGSFSDILRRRHGEAFVAAYDYEPEADKPYIKQQDFYKLTKADLPRLSSADGAYHVVGNPPFGVGGSDSKRFVKHAATFAASISFILPVSMKKEHGQRSVPKLFHLTSEITLPLDVFHYRNGKACKVPCVWQIWEKRSYARAPPAPQPNPRGFLLLKDSNAEEPTHMIVRTGFYSGKIEPYKFKPESGKPTTRNHNWGYLYFDDALRRRPGFEAAIRRAEKALVEMDASNTGPRNANNTQIITALNSAIAPLL
jgi:hypothetical protein